MPKNFIICGCPLVGKSTFSDRIHAQFGFSYIPTDAFVTAFEKVFPDIGISHTQVSSVNTWESVTNGFYPFLRCFIDELDDQNIYNGYVIEGFHIDIEQAVRDFGETHVIIVFGYPNISLEEKFDIIRRYDTNNWTNQLDDSNLREHIKLFIEISQYYQQICLQSGARFVDLSYDRNTVLENLVEEFI